MCNPSAQNQNNSKKENYAPATSETKQDQQPTAIDATPRKPAMDESVAVPPLPVSNYAPVKTRSGRLIKQKQNPDFVYCSNDDYSDVI